MGANVFLHGQSIQNVNPTSAVPLSIFSHDPTTYNTNNFTLGWHWLNKTNLNLWYLAALKVNNVGTPVATWLLLSGASGVVISLEGNAGFAFPVLGNVKVIANTAQGTTRVLGDNVNTLTIDFVDVNENLGIGTNSMHLIPSGTENVAYGSNALFALTLGSDNTALGTNTLSSITTGTFNTALGVNAGSNYTTETSNITLGNVAGTGGESGVIRIGAAGLQNKCFIAGIVGNTVLNENLVTINTVTGQLGNIAGTGAGTVTGLKADDGNTVTPTAGVINVVGGTGIATTGTVGPNTLTITNTAPYVNPASAASFFAYNATDTANYFTLGSAVQVVCATSVFNNGGVYNTGTSTFTAPATGYYYLQATVGIFSTPSTVTEYSLFISLTGGDYLGSNGNPFSMQDALQQTLGINQSIFVFMNSGDTARIFFIIGGSGGNSGLIGKGGAYGPGYRTYFQGYRVA